MPNNPDHAVEVHGITKDFRVPHEKVSSLKGHATRMFKRVPVTKFRVLDDITFSIKRGEFFSIIGANGSGKSTLLKLLAGIYVPTAGSITHNGTLTTMIELGVGFNFDLSGRDNIYLNAALFGMSRAEVEAAYDTIVSFAEVEEFIDQKVKNYSSGMQVRLAFSIAIQAKADIIVVDEVLAVGDATFQQKCFDVFRELKALGKTIIFVSHDLGAVQDFSDRVLLLSHSKQIGIFEPMEAIKRYQEINRSDMEGETVDPLKPQEPEKEPEIDKTKPHLGDVTLLSTAGKPIKSIKRGDSCRISVTVHNPGLEKIEVGVSLVRNDGMYCFGTSSEVENIAVPVKKTTKVVVHFKDMPLQKGTYYIVAGVFGEHGRVTYEMRLRARQFRVSQADRTEGVVSLNRRWEFK